MKIKVQGNKRQKLMKFFSVDANIKLQVNINYSQLTLATSSGVQGKITTLMFLKEP